MRNRNRFVLTLSVGILALGVPPAFIGLTKARELGSNTDWLLAGAAVGLALLSYAAISLRFATVNRLTGIKAASHQLAALGFVTTSLGRVAFAGGAIGTVFRIAVLRSQGVPVASTLAAGLLHAYLSQLVVLLVLLASVGFVMSSGTLPAFGLGAIAAGALVVLIITLAAAGLLCTAAIREKVLSAAELAVRVVARRDISQHLERFKNTLEQGLQSVRERPRRLLMPVALVFLDVVGSVGALWLSFAALGGAVELSVVIAGLGVGTAMGAISFLPGGLGVQEGSMTGVYSLLGVGFEQALFVSILYRFVYYLAPFAFSLLFYWFLLRLASKRPMDVEDQYAG